MIIESLRQGKLLDLLQIVEQIFWSLTAYLPVCCCHIFIFYSVMQAMMNVNFANSRPTLAYASTESKKKLTLNLITSGKLLCRAR